MRKLLVVILLSITVIAVSCRKNKTFSNDTSRNIELSSDTLTFDTVFTCVGSATRILMVYNNTDDNLKISSIRLEQGSSSPYSVNVDGASGTTFQDIEIYAHDSLYVFVKVTIDPTDENNPFFVEDRLLFNTNGNQTVAHLTAYGQNAHYIIGNIGIFPDSEGHYTNYYTPVTDSVNKDVHWTAEKPYVIYNVALIDSEGTLTIEAGTRVYFHGGSGLWAWSEGQLIVDGTAENPVIFQGDRLEDFYADEPGQWDRIWLMEAREGHGHSINHAIIKNGFIGLQLQRMLKDNMAQADITNTIIENHTGMGIYTNCYTANVWNVLIDNCGYYCAALTGGGNYLFRHTTLANFWTNSARQTPALYFDNYYTDPTDGNTYAMPFNCELANSIVYGNHSNEFDTDFYEQSSDTTYRFSHCLLGITRPHSDESMYEACVFNEKPKFVNTEEFDYHLDTLSPAIGIGNPAISTGILRFDLDGVDRGDSPDAGAYQYYYSRIIL